MPTYEYRCKACQRRFEIFQPITAAPKRKCPHCTRSTLERLISSGAGILFRGQGFYQTDYRSESYKRGAEAEKAPDAATAKTDAAGDQPKPPGEKAATPKDPKPPKRPKRPGEKPRDSAE